MKDIDFIEEYLNRYQKSLLENDVSNSMIAMKKLLLQTRNKGKKVLIAGNGGSAAMSSHVSVDLTKQAGIRTVNFNEADLITCFANDYGYENVFIRQVEALGNKGDVVIGITTSGKSSNIINGMSKAKDLGCTTIALTGISEGLLDKISDYIVKIPSDDTPRIQEHHILFGHIICELVENEIFG